MSANRYVKKPVVIEAVRWTGENVNEVTAFAGGCLLHLNDLHIPTLEGGMRADVGDYIIRGVKGEFYPCKPDIFEMTYEEVQS